MIKMFLKSLEIDISYTTNSFIYVLRDLPVFKDLITDDIYSSTIIKKIIQIFITVYLFLKVLALKFFYFFLIFSISYYYRPNYLVKTYYHVYFVLTILGLFINNKLLNTTKKKYFSLITFNMEGDKYYHTNLIGNQLTNLILNSIMIFFFGSLLQAPIRYNILLIVFSFFTRLIGEAFNIYFYKKKRYIWYSNSKLYGTILIGFTLLASLPVINIYFTFKIIFLGTFISVVLGLISLKYLLGIKDYKLMYKKLAQVTQVMNSKNDKDYLKQEMMRVREKDKKIDNKKLKGKKGYDLFNTIFFERHKEILIRSAKKYSVILVGIYLVLSYFIVTKTGFSKEVGEFLNNNLGWFVVIMYFINRGAIITQAMFFNCDHAMLTYNFYREPKTLLNLFKKRLMTIIKVNLLPACIVGIGNTVLFILTKQYDIVTIISSFLFIVFLSIFYSVHYLVIYYLLQPFNKELEVKKISYSFATLGTYILAYTMTNVVMNSIYLSVLGLILTILYIIIALKLVYQYAPKTFKLN